MSRASQEKQSLILVVDALLAGVRWHQQLQEELKEEEADLGRSGGEGGLFGLGQATQKRV